MLWGATHYSHSVRKIPGNEIAKITYFKIPFSFIWKSNAEFTLGSPLPFEQEPHSHYLVFPSFLVP